MQSGVLRPSNSRSTGNFPRPTACSSGKTPLKFDGKAIERRLPVADRHRPLLGNVAHRQINHLVDRFIRGENPVIARHGCRSVILTDESAIGRVDYLTDVLWEGKERDDAWEVGLATIC
jgi:hypothetical protein